MGNEDRSREGKVVDLAKHRKRTINGAVGLIRKNKGRTSKSTNKGMGIAWYHYLQFLLALGMVAWLMQLCGAGGF